MTKPLNILMIARYFPPLDSIATMRMYSWAKYLHRAGCRITVLTTDKSGQVVSPFQADTSYCEVCELPYFDPLLKLGFDRARAQKDAIDPSFSLLSGLKSSLRRFYDKRMNERMPGRTDPWIFAARRQLKRWKAEGKDFDLMISSYGPPSAHIVGGMARRIFGGVWVADYRDLWLENIREGLWPFQYFEKFLEKRYVGRADLLTTVSNPLADILAEKFPSIPTAVIENGFDEEEMGQGRRDFFAGEPKKLRIIHTGTLSEELHNPQPLMQAVSELIQEGAFHPKEIEVLFYGHGSGQLPGLIQRFHLEDIVRYCGMVPRQTAYDIQHSADLLLFLEVNFKGYQGILSGKIFEYLFSPVPILSVGSGWQDQSSGKLIEEAKAGYICRSDVALIKKTLLDKKRGIPSSQKDRERINRYSRKSQVERLLEIVGPLIKQGNS